MLSQQEADQLLSEPKLTKQSTGQNEECKILSQL